MNQKIVSYLTRIRSSMDLVFAISGLSVSIIAFVFSIFFKFYFALGLAISVILAASIYLFLRPRLQLDLQREISESSKVYKGKAKRNFLVIVSVVIVVLSLIIIFFSTNVKIRSLWIFFVLALIPALIYLLLITTQEDPLSRPIIRTLIIIFTITLILSGIYIFPHNGSDSWRHISNAETLLAAGNLSNIEGVYSNFPLYPYYIGLFSQFFSISIADSAGILNVIEGVVFVLLFFAAAAKLNLSDRQTTVLALFLLGSKWFVYWAYNVVSMTFAMLFFGLFFILILTALNNKITNNSLVLLLFLAVFSPFVHPMISGAIIIFLVFFVIVNSIEKFSMRNEVTVWNVLALLLIFTIILVTQWMYYGEQVFDQIVPKLLRPIFFEENPVSLSESYRDPVGFTLDQLSFYPILALGFFEVLKQLKLKSSPANLYSGMIGIFFIIFAYLTQIINFTDLLPHRWLYLGTIALVLPAACAFTGLSFVRRGVGKVLSTLFIFLFFFTAVINTEANADSPFYNVETTIRLGVTSSEKAGFDALNTLIELRDSNVRFDFQVWDYLHGIYAAEQISNISYWKEMKLDGFDGVFSLRQIQLERPLIYNMPFAEIPDTNQTISLFYDSGDFWLLEKVKSENELGFE